LQPYAVNVANDVDGEGAAITKNRALAAVATEWVAVLDSDDQFEPQHLAKLAAAQQETGADVIYPWPIMDCALGGGDPRPEMFGKPFDPADLRRFNFIPTTVLMRTDLARKVGGFQRRPGEPWDDHGLFVAMLDAGAVFHHHPERTWIWTIHGQNTSGLPERWQ